MNKKNSKINLHSQFLNIIIAIIQNNEVNSIVPQIKTGTTSLVPTIDPHVKSKK